MSSEYYGKCRLLSTLKRSVSGIIAFSFAALLATNASANSKYAAIVVDGNTGKVLHASQADAPRYPASLTKIMTLYILFDYLKKGRLTKNTKFYVTPHSSAQPPSKLGLKAGAYIKVRDVIGALVTKSANDVAATVAENIAGNEEKFAKLMTRKARSLGMNNTVFMNASGLPNRLQKTTARDMAKLSMRMMNDFPAYAKSFKTRYYKYRRKSFRNHNRLLFTYKGTEGIKTGYTRASGFNLTTSVKRGRKHLIAVVMGGRTGGSRNRAMASLLNKGFKKTSSVSKSPIAQRMARVDPNSSPAVVRVARKPVAPPPVASASHTAWQNNQPKQYARKSSIASQSFGIGQYIGRTSREGYDIQIGSFTNRNEAVGKLTQVKRTANALSGHQPYIMPFEKNGVNYHRARFTGFSTRKTATNACGQLKKRLKMDCIVMVP